MILECLLFEHYLEKSDFIELFQTHWEYHFEILEGILLLLPDRQLLSSILSLQRNTITQLPFCQVFLIAVIFQKQLYSDFGLSESCSSCVHWSLTVWLLPSFHNPNTSCLYSCACIIYLGLSTWFLISRFVESRLIGNTYREFWII